MNRNYPFGWGSNIGVTFAARGAGPGSEPEVQNTMDIVQNNQVVALLTMHTNSHAIFYPGLEIAAGLPADLDPIRGLRVAMADATNNGYTNVRDSAHDYETSGETIDWSYYATRGFAGDARRPSAARLVDGSTPNRPAVAELPQLHDGRLHRHARPDGDRGADRPLRRPPGPQRPLPDARLRGASRRPLA